MNETLCPLIREAADSPSISRELVRQFNPSSHRGSIALGIDNGLASGGGGGNGELVPAAPQLGLEQNNNGSVGSNGLLTAAATALGTKVVKLGLLSTYLFDAHSSRFQSGSQRLLAFYLFETCLALKEFRDLARDLSDQERRALELKDRIQDWYVPVLTAWVGVVRDKVKANVEGPCAF